MAAHLRALASGRPAALGMVHVHALPGTPKASAPLSSVIEIAVTEARQLAAAGFVRAAIVPGYLPHLTPPSLVKDGILLENMHDIPYLGSGAYIGVQVLAGANREALSVALAAELDCIRAEGFVFGHVADEGWIEACAGDLLRFRRAVGAENVAVFADVKKKHSAHAVTADVGLGETVHAASFFEADGVVVTGTATGASPPGSAPRRLHARPRAGDPARAEDVSEAIAASEGRAVIVGSGATASNVGDYAHADAVVVGSSLKRGGHWARPIDDRRAREFVEAVRALAGRERAE